MKNDTYILSNSIMLYGVFITPIKKLNFFFANFEKYAKFTPKNYCPQRVTYQDSSTQPCKFTFAAQAQIFNRKHDASMELHNTACVTFTCTT